LRRAATLRLIVAASGLAVPAASAAGAPVNLVPNAAGQPTRLEVDADPRLRAPSAETPQSVTIGRMAAPTRTDRRPRALLVGRGHHEPRLSQGLNDLQAAFPKTRGELIPGQRHIAHVFAADTFADLVADFLR
jgi:hypothetical protein